MLSNFWRTLDMPVFNCEINLILTWSKNCVLANKIYREAVAGDNPVLGIDGLQQMQHFK